MTRFFIRDSPLAAYERMMMQPPNFRPRGGGHTILCRYKLKREDVNCKLCTEYRGRSCRVLHCPYLAERISVGAVTYSELVKERARSIRCPLLRQRIVEICTTLHLSEQHRQRMTECISILGKNPNNQYLAAVFVLAAKVPLWKQMQPLVTNGKIDFSKRALHDLNTSEYALFRMAKGLADDEQTVADDELADEQLIDDDTLNLIVAAKLIAQYGSIIFELWKGEKNQ